MLVLGAKDGIPRRALSQCSNQAQTGLTLAAVPFCSSGLGSWVAVRSPECRLNVVGQCDPGVLRAAQRPDRVGGPISCSCGAGAAARM